MIKQLVEHAIKELVDEPSKVNVQVFRDGQKTITEIRVAADDFKRVIGKDGRIIKSLRAMIGAVDGGDNDIVIDIAQ
ncbi:MAG: KH domain-containing protein [Candidatus Babeliales bacterium]